MIAQSALADLQDIKAYYHQQGAPEVGVKFVVAILDRVQTLLLHPDSGRKVPEFEQDQIREVIFPPFRLVYLRSATEISLVRVWRSERLLSLPENNL